jgi:hypothetical protein
MTPTNTAIAKALFDKLIAASLGYEILMPGLTGGAATPPALGIWLEPMVMPNTGIDNGLAPTDGTVPQGLFQVAVYDRPGRGILEVNRAADDVKAAFLKNATITGLVRVQRNPWSFEIQPDGDRLSVIVTIPYTG